MKFSVFWAPAAISSLDAIVAWLEEHWSKKEADQFLGKTFSIIDILRQQP